MKAICWKAALFVVLCGSSAWGQDIEQVNWGRRLGRPVCPPEPCAPSTAPPSPTTPTPSTPQSPSERALSESFAQAGEGGTMPEASFMPAFFGDLFGIMGSRFFPGGNTGNFPSVLKVPSASRGSGFKVTDGESPRPQNRVYFTFNYYNDVARSLNGDIGGQAWQGYRYLIGLEKTLFQGNASVGLRLPWVNVTGVPGFNDQQFGDMSIVTKYALVNRPDRVLSGGLVITVPTGQGFVVDLPNPRTGTIIGPNPYVLYDTVLQPWGGFIQNLGERLYVHGFSSVAVPTNELDVTILISDVGLGYWLYRNANDRFIQGVIPTFEMHGNTPLNHQSMRTVPIGFSDQFNLTGGIYIVLPRSLFGFAAGVPVVGPKPYDYELTAHCSLRF